MQDTTDEANEQLLEQRAEEEPEVTPAMRALIRKLAEMRAVGMTREQRRAQIPAPKREPGKREMARRVRQMARDGVRP